MVKDEECRRVGAGSESDDMKPFGRNGSVFASVATDDECGNPLAALDGRGWLPASAKGLDVLCLASGGGWQSILYACAVSNVTVVDLSPGYLDSQRSCDASRASLCPRTCSPESLAARKTRARDRDGRRRGPARLRSNGAARTQVAAGFQETQRFSGNTEK
jgi:hypothetical protein